MEKVLLVGAGNMAKDYTKVLKELNVDFDVVCRSEISAQNFTSDTGIHCYSGGLNNYIATTQFEYSKAIVATGIESLKENTISLINKGIQSLLIEKPGGLNIKEIQDLYSYSTDKGSLIYVAYNRRFYASVEKAMDIIKDDGGVLSGNFEFTEWAHIIEPLKKAPGIKENWFLANSTHVVDLAFFLIGEPKQMSSYTSNKTSWHNPAIYAGSGITESGALFSYKANWISAGRWSIEILTPKRKLILQPIEKLQEQLIGSIQINEVNGIDYSIEEKFKPGLFLQTQHFLCDNINNNRLKTLEEHFHDLKHYQQICKEVL